MDSFDLPRQYYTYLSGNVDPDFRNDFIFNRTSDLNDITLGIRQYDIGGPSMNGLILEENGKPIIMTDFKEAFNNAGNNPVELVRWDMTGNRPNLTR